MKYEIVQPIKLIEYSEKCLAVVGETKQFKEALKEMGGRYNPALSCGPAWIFPVKKREEVTGYSEHNPNHCGLILYASPDESHVRGNRVGSCCLNVGAELMHDYQLTTDEELKLLRLLGMRVWNIKKKLAEYQAEPSLFKR